MGFSVSTTVGCVPTAAAFVIGFSELLVAKVKDPVLKNYTEGIRVGSKNLLQLINDILDLSKIESGYLEVKSTPFRLSTLQRPGLKGIPIFFARIDRAGNITKRHSAAKLQFARFGAACPLWNAHQAFEMPGQINRQLAETPDGVRYLCLSMQISKGGRGFRKAQQHYALALGCEISYADSFVYADDLDLDSRAAFEPIGISCRICERHNCPQRAMPPLKSRLTVDHDNRSIVPYRIV